MHHNRHKEILRIIRQIHALDKGDTGLASPLFLGEKRRESSSTSTPTDTSSETLASDGIKLTRRERKKAKKNGNATSKNKTGLEIFSTDELDFISEAIHLTKHESKGAWAGTYNYGEVGEPAMMNEATGADDIIIDPILPRVEELTGRSLANMTPRQRKTVKKYSNTLTPTAYKNGSRKFLSATSSDIYNMVDPQILFRLAVDVTNPANNTKARKDLSIKLVAAIKEDLDIVEREEEESALRREGFWRWAGKTTYQYIARVRKDFDWATGQKIEQKDSKRPREQDFQDFAFTNVEEDGVDENTVRGAAQEQSKSPTSRETKSLSDSLKAVNRPFTVLTPKQNGKLNISTSPTKSSWLESPTINLAPPTPALDSAAWTPNRPLKITTTPAKIVSTTAKSPFSSEDDGAWETVKPGKGSRMVASHYKVNPAEPQVAYRKPSEHNILYLK